jgi:DNA-binding response OmpR family regulator
LGGTLTLASQPGQGAAFTLTFCAERLPAKAAAETTLAVAAEASSGLAPTEAGLAAAGAPGPALAPVAGRPRILLVEDHAELRAYINSLLAPAYEVLEAADGQQALAVLAREPVDLVASDAMMPHLSGLELLQALKADPAHQSLPFLMVTARADEAHRLSALATGVDDYLIKPFEPGELLARVRTLLARRQVRQQFADAPPEPAPVAEALRPGPAPAREPVSLAPVPDPATQLAQWQAQLAGHLVDPAFGPAEVAALLCLSERTLYRRLGELAGLTPAAWLRELRLSHARRLLEAGDFGSVAEVAEAAGFINVKSFSARYAERFGRRPSEYQPAHR